METLDLESPVLEDLEKLEDYVQKRFGRQVIGGEASEQESSVDLYILGSNRRAKAGNINRLMPHVQDPHLLVSFKNVGFEEYNQMVEKTLREKSQAIVDLNEGLDQSLGDYLVFVEEYYDLISDGEIESELFHISAEVSGLETVMQAASKVDEAIRRDEDYVLQNARLVGGVERPDVRQAMNDIQPAVVLEIGYSGDEDALAMYNQYLDESTSREGDADAIPGTVYIGRQDYPEVVFNGPPYDTLQDGELEKDLWEEIRDK